MVGNKRRNWLRSPIAALVVAVTGLVPSATATAGAGSPTLPNVVITAFSDPGSFVGHGVPQEFDQTNASVSGTATAAGLNLSVSGGTAGLAWSFMVDPPPGSSFRVGYYSKAQATRSAGYAELSISGPGGACGSPTTGAFDVRDLAVSGSAITRLDLVYELPCGPAVFGEIRIGEPRTAGLIVSSASITWPGLSGIGLGGHGTAVPVYIRNPGTAPVPIGAATLSGFAAQDFSVADNTCSGSSLPPGYSCSLFLRFIPMARGPRSAALRLPLGARAASIQLDGLVRPGTTSLTMESKPGDLVGQGLNYDLTPANTLFGFSAAPSGLEADLTTGDGVQPWIVDMYAPPGKTLAVGTYPNAARYPYNGNNPGLSVTGNSNGCNSITGSFTIKQIAFSPSDGSLKNFDGTFTQYCDTDSAPLTGELRYDAEPVTAPPPAVSRLKAVPASSGLDITWANPASSMYRYTLVRIEPSGTPVGVAPYSGMAVAAGTGTSAVAHGLISGHRYTVVAYTVDEYGNVSHPARYTVTF